MKRTMILVAICLILILTGCDVTIHQYPNPQESQVIIEPYVNRDAPCYYKTVIYDDNWNSTIVELPDKPAYQFLADKRVEVRIIADVYRGTIKDKLSENLVERRIINVNHNALPPQDTIHFNLPDGDYYVLAWADYVVKGNDIGPFLADTLTAVHSRLDKYPKNPFFRSSASGVKEFSIDFTNTPEGYPITRANDTNLRTIPVSLDRPVARYRIVALDYKDFLQSGGNIEDVTIKVIYKQFVSVGFNVLTDAPNEFISTYSFNIKPADIVYEGEEYQNSLFSDYVFTSENTETNIIIDLYFYDETGKEINHCQGIKIPLMRDQETVVQGNFLTQPLGKGEGVSIDDNFEGEYVIDLNF